VRNAFIIFTNNGIKITEHGGKSRLTKDKDLYPIMWCCPLAQRLEKKEKQSAEPRLGPHLLGPGWMVQGHSEAATMAGSELLCQLQHMLAMEPQTSHTISPCRADARTHRVTSETPGAT
jgi:hypothetical protein